MSKPVLLEPAAKDYLWGGNRLNDDYHFDIPVTPFAEAWLCSTHPDGESRVSGKDLTLTELLKEHPEYLGTHPLQLTGGKPELPILVKLIDAAKDLSIQVHPDDEYAYSHEKSLGKTEMWYVIDAERGATLVHGFQRDVNEKIIRKAIDRGKIKGLLNTFPVRRNDIFYIEAGTVHAIGAGVLLAEVQENSNLTYRLYDYDRVDKNGEKRELHIDKAMDVVKMKSTNAPRQPMRVLRYRNGMASELLSRCRYFQVERVLLNTEVQRGFVEFGTGENSFHALLCVGGCGILFGENVTIPFFKGDCIFVPAGSSSLKLHGKAQLLNISC